MDFQIYECTSPICKNNAFARKAKNGTKEIVYDNEWLKKLISDSLNTASLTILAHEIGHHVAGHTLNLSTRGYEEAISFCYPRSSNYDETVCDSFYRPQYCQYLERRRSQELQADRIAGYIMERYGRSLEDIAKAYSSFAIDYNERCKTHPSLSKRLNAISAGHKLSILSRKRNEHIDIYELKGPHTDIVIPDDSTSFYNRIKANVEKAINSASLKVVKSASRGEITRVSGHTPQHDFLKKKYYQSIKDYELINILSSRFIIRALRFSYNQNIGYEAGIGTIIVPNRLIIIVVEPQKGPTIIYSTTLDSIELREIEQLFYELFYYGFTLASEQE